MSIFQGKRKVYNTLYGSLDHTYFYLTSNKLDFALIGTSGLMKTSIDIEYDGPEICFGFDFKKFDTVLQKFSTEETVKFTIGDTLLKISVPNRSDVVNLQIVKEGSDSKAVANIKDGIQSLVERNINPKHRISLTQELINNVNLFNYVFNSSFNTNAIGLTQEYIMYSDRNVVIKSTLSERLSDDLFDTTTSESPYIYLHVDTLKLLILLSSFRNDYMFDDSYDILYWEDDNTKLIFNNETKMCALPDNDQYEGIKPHDTNVTFSISVSELDNTLDFFDGIYVESNWKPLNFETLAGHNVNVRYTHPTTDASKEIEGCVSNFTGSFLIDADTLKKILTKIKDFGLAESDVVFNYDEDTCEEPAVGVMIHIGDKFEAVISKLVGD